MNSDSILSRHEYGANRFAAKVMLISILAMLLVYLMNLLGIFIIPLPTMTIGVLLSALFLSIPYVIVHIMKIQTWWVKYVTVITAAIALACLNTFLTYHIVVINTYALAIASLYFSRRLSWFAVILSIVLLSTSQVLSLYVGGHPDNNFIDLYSTIVYGAIPRSMQILALSLIFTELAKNMRKMLENVVGAEEQKKVLDRVLSITNKSFEVSNVLADSVNQLSEITDHTSKANEQIAGNTGRIASGSEDTIKLVDEATDAIVSISNNLNKIAEENNYLAEVSNQVKLMTESNGIIIKEAVHEMSAIEKSTSESMEIISKLAERSTEIGRIVEVITGISEQTNLLALNAAIESARAGEQGRGFAVVSSEIRGLAEKSGHSAKDISDMINTVLEDTKKAVESMDRVSKLVCKGLEFMGEAGKCFEKVAVSGKEMNDKVQGVSKVTKEVAVDGDKIVSIVKNIRDINYSSRKELQHIAESAQEQLTSMQQVETSVDTIKKISGELIEVVKER